MYALDISWIPAIFLIPLLGALLNGLLGKRLGKSFVRVIGVGAPAIAFVLCLAAFFGMYVADAGDLPTRSQNVTVSGPAPSIQSLKGRLSAHPIAGNWATRRGADDTQLVFPGLNVQDTSIRGTLEALTAVDSQLKVETSTRFKRGVVIVRAPTIEKLMAAKAAIHKVEGSKNWTMREERIENRPMLRIRNMEAQEWIDNPGLNRIRLKQNLTIAPASEAPRSYRADLGEWIRVGELNVPFAFHVDRLAIILMLVITGVGFLIHLYSVGYMAHETVGGFARYFCFLNLFVGSMLILVMADNLLLLFIGWEGVGMCSYLLIGFDYHDPDKAACGTKAFVVNRIGDFGFVLGTLALLVFASSTGQPFSLDFKVLNQLPFGQQAAAPSLLMGGACLLLFFGACGKSAQIPLHLWLPDAMAGPTPVSALIHAATMVTAGVYMICRLSHLFSEAVVFGVPVLGIVAVIGVLTAFFAACAALGQDDIKSVLAYSTISQLGYMFVAVGAMAFGAAIGHLVTHAFFKAVLFLCAGAVIHATHTQSMREMGGLRRLMPTTFWTMTVGAAALAGFPLLTSGFFSKDMILFETLMRGQAGGHFAWLLIYVLGVLTGFLTAVYSTRMILLTFFGDYRGRGKPHPAPTSMAAPLVVLGVLAIGGGILVLPGVFPGSELLPHYLGQIAKPLSAKMTLLADVRTSLGVDKVHQFEWLGLGIGALAALGGIVLGWHFWGGGRSPTAIPWEDDQIGPVAGLRRLLSNAWYYDELVNKKFIQPAVLYISSLMWKHIDDTAIDQGLVDGTGRVAVQLSLFTRVFQTGKVSRYAAYFVMGAILLMLLSHVPTLSKLAG